MNSEQTYQNKEWHWLWGGIIVSVLSMLSYVIFEKLSYKDYPFGITAGIAYITSSLQFVFTSLADNPLIQKNWTSTASFVEFVMLIGIVAGGYIAAKSGKTYSPQNIPQLWMKYHGKSVIKRFSVALLGGFLLGLGAVLAGGCTTGNILQGWAHLSTGSLIAGAMFFVSGSIVAKLLYPKLKGGK